VQAAIAALHARAEKPEDTDCTHIDLLYGALELMQPSPVVTLNRAVAVFKVRGPQAALELIEPLAPRLLNYFHYFGVRGAAATTRRGWRSTAPLRLPTPLRKRRISACISIA
jgi:RNA polymerase sigma-70 factor (ECF subfamily)